MLIFKKRKIKLIPTIFKLFLVIVVFYFAFSLMSQQNQINIKKKKLDEINSKLAVQNAKNEELKDFLKKTENNSSEYLERLAREKLDLVKKGERVFINISGN